MISEKRIPISSIKAFLKNCRPFPVLRHENEFDGRFNWTSYQSLLRKAWTEHFPAAQTILLISLTSPEQDLELFMGKIYPYQRAILLLHIQSWRASFCPKCGTRFAKAKPGDRFCGKKCAGSYRKDYQHALYLKDGKKWRAKAKKRAKKLSKKSRKAGGK